MLKVFVAQHPVQAHLVLGILEAEGIPGEIRGEALFTTLQGGASAPGMLPTVWIAREEQALEAKALVDRFSLDEGDAGVGLDPWLCPGCGERHEAQFSHCWKCGEARG